MTRSFARPEFTLALAPSGEAYLVASQRDAGRNENQVSLWRISGDFPPEPILTPWFYRASQPPQAAFFESSKVQVAWAQEWEIFVETFSLPVK